MASKEDIYQLKKIRGKYKQPVFTSEFNELDKLTNNLKYKHPYEAAEELFKAWNSHNFYAKGANGPIAVIDKTHNYLYRLCNIESLLNPLRNNTPEEYSKFNAGKGVDELIKHKFDELLNLSEENKNLNELPWVRLDRLFPEIKFFPCYRNFAWFTSENLDRIIEHDQKEIAFVEYGFKLGMINDFFSEHSIVIRYEVFDNDMKNIRVPTIIDAYDQYIFDEQKIYSSIEYTEYGKSIQISKCCCNGFREYAVKEIDIKRIELFPIPLEIEKLIDKFPDCEEEKVLSKIINCYNDTYGTKGPFNCCQGNPGCPFGRTLA